MAPPRAPDRTASSTTTSSASVVDFLGQRPPAPRQRGSTAERILIDPGHDFGKNTRHSLAVTRALDQLVTSGRPLLVSLSNKDFVGETLDAPVGERLVGTLATTAISSWLGAQVFRVHEVPETRAGSGDGAGDRRGRGARGGAARARLASSRAAARATAAPVQRDE